MIGTALELCAAACLALTSPADRVDADRVMETLGSLPHDRSVRAALQGSEADAEGLRKTREMIRSALDELGHEVHTQDVVWAPPNRGGDGPYEGQNLWVDLLGETSPEEVYVFVAHFDAVPNSPGADDNGTGTAGALELARVLTGVRTQRTVRVLFVTAEEVGLVGARRYAQEIARPAIDAGEESILGAVSLEMLGYYTDEPGTQRSPIPAIPGVYEPPTVGDFISVVGLSSQLGFVRPFSAGLRRGAGEVGVFELAISPVPVPDMARSDHAEFWRIGVPAVMLTDTANFRNPHYHRRSDTVDTIDRDRYVAVVRGVVQAAWELSGPIRDADGDD
jgi:hypothetical protein